MPWFLSCFLACHPQPEDEARDPQKPYFLLAEKYVTDRIRNLALSLPLKMEATTLRTINVNRSEYKGKQVKAWCQKLQLVYR